jgi:hypothetical protein
MAEGPVAQVEKGAKQFFTAPLVAITTALIGLVLVVLIEIFKPGLITGPIRRGLGLVGLKGK